MKATAFVILLAWSASLLAQNAPRPPCLGPGQPSYAQHGQQPNLLVWRHSSKAPWTAPPCTGWKDAAEGMLLVALAGTLSYSGSAEQLLNRFLMQYYNSLLFPGFEMGVDNCPFNCFAYSLLQRIIGYFSESCQILGQL